MKDSKINNMFLVNRGLDGYNDVLHPLRKGLLGDLMFLQKMYACYDMEYALESFNGRDRLSYAEFMRLEPNDQLSILRWFAREWGHKGDVGYALNDNCRCVGRMKRPRNAQLLKLAKQPSYFWNRYKKALAEELI